MKNMFGFASRKPTAVGNATKLIIKYILATHKLQSIVHMILHYLALFFFVLKKENINIFKSWILLDDR
uniref:Uncharacterized protein n=1 Tax=Arundo donax TaxID=35708 RepID=A0A0A9GJG4_ARUDO